MMRPRSVSKERISWFVIRRDLPRHRQTLLGFLSFLLPIGIWCLVSYVPSIWHPDIRLTISAEREGSSTVYIPGNHLSKDFFPTFVAGIERDNEAILAARESGEATTQPARLVRRQNQRLVRQIAHFAYMNGWIERHERQNDEKLLEVYRGLAEGTLQPRRHRLTPENELILRRNWEMLRHMETFSTAELPEEPLLKLLPQGVPANPVFLPAPHEVVTTGIRIFTTKPEGDSPSMTQRLRHSLRIVFTGFLISCLIGIPLGILVGTYDFFARLFEPFIDFFRYMPAPVFSTLLVAIFAANDAPKIALIFLGTFFQMVLVIGKTTRLLDRSLLEAAQTLGARNVHLVGRVIIPGVMPNVYNDLRILLGWSWTWLVIAELIGVKSGLTEFIETQGRWRNFDQVFPVIIMIGLIGFTTDQILAFLRRFFFPWEPKGISLGAKLAWLTEGHRRP